MLSIRLPEYLQGTSCQESNHMHIGNARTYYHVCSSDWLQTALTQLQVLLGRRAL